LIVVCPFVKKKSQTSESALRFAGAESRTQACLVKMQIKAALVQYGLKEPLNVDVVVLNDTAVLIGIVDDEQERAAMLEIAERTKSIHHVVNFLLLPEPGYEKLLRLP
jgi:osmotically-inducible protein OsmY